MNEIFTLLPAWFAGLMLGTIFFGGLWWTVRKITACEQPALWFLGSLLVRMGVVLAGFYFVMGGRWERLLACLVGFVMARLIVTWLTRPLAVSETNPIEEARHAH